MSSASIRLLSTLSFPVDPSILSILSEQIHDNFWQEHPVLVLSKTRNAHSRFIRSTLYQLNIQPSPLFLDINERSDVDILLPIFHRLIGQSDLPVLIIGGEVVGGWYETDA